MGECTSREMGAYNTRNISIEQSNFWDSLTYWINEAGKVLLHRVFVLTVIYRDRCIHRHQTDSAILILTKRIECKLEIRRRNETGQDAIPENRQSAVQLARHEQVLQLLAQVRCRNEWGVGNIDNAAFVRWADDIAKLGIGEGL